MNFFLRAAFLIALILFITGCSNSFSELNADVINTHGSVEGVGSMEDFYKKVHNRSQGLLRVIHYTDEGDPLITDLKFDGKEIEVKYDTTRDQFGHGEVTKTTCSELLKEENPTNLTYYMTGCSGVNKMDKILQVRYSVKQQDVFEVKLKYGDNLEKQITELNEADKQEVYKRLVIANYLDIDKLDDKCGGDAENYSMHIKINGGERSYDWASCDKSVIGKMFTDIAQYIIKQSEKPTQTNKNIIFGYILSIENNELFIGEDLSAVDYQSLKDVPKEDLLNGFIFDFLYIESENAGQFAPGDKVAVEIDGEIQEVNPPRAEAVSIEKMN